MFCYNLAANTSVLPDPSMFNQLFLLTTSPAFSVNMSLHFSPMITLNLVFFFLFLDFKYFSLIANLDRRGAKYTFKVHRFHPF